MLINNPVIALSCSAIAAAIITALWSTGMLMSTLLYQPALNITRNTASQAISPINSNDISERNFFGIANAKPEIIVEDLPETKLELTLRGAFTAQQESNAGAIIEDDKKNSKHYAIGDTLPGDAVLKSIHPNKVVLTRNGIFETLYFPEAKDNSSAISQLRSLQGSDFDKEERRKAIRERINKLRKQKK